VDRDGVAGKDLLNRLPIAERALLFTEGPHGPEPLWLWLNEQGLPFHPHSWNGVFRTANQRCCETALTSPKSLGMDPHRVYAPYATVHSCAAVRTATSPSGSPAVHEQVAQSVDARPQP
jgi:hypothetical protein